MDNNNEIGQRAAYLTERLVAEGSVPAYLKKEFKRKRDIKSFVNEYIANVDQFYEKVDEEGGFDAYPDDVIKYLLEATVYSSDVIELVLWFDECYGMANGYHTILGKCPECGHDELFIREGPDGMYSTFIQCGKCAMEYDYEEFNNMSLSDINDFIDFDEKRPLIKEE